MPNCPNCSANVTDRTDYCGKCGTPINAPATSVSVAQPQVTSHESNAWSNTSNNVNMSLRLEKAMKRAETLGYAAAGLGLAILAVILIISFLLLHPMKDHQMFILLGKEEEYQANGTIVLR